jgi:formylglycine-generating enzyme required for sulfatase activity
MPCEYHPDTSELIQMLQKGHHGVRLDAEAWDRLVTWIDLNIPCHGTWGEFRTIPGDQRARRCELRKQFAGIEADYETIPDLPGYRPAQAMAPAPPRILEAPAEPVALAGWPFDAAEAKRRQAAAGGRPEETIELGNDAQGQPVTMDLVLVPAGTFLMGDPEGYADERPVAPVRITRPFLMGKHEVTNQQFALFDPAHDSRYFNRMGKDQNTRGEPMNQARQPVVRVSWEEAMAFCRWLSERAGRRITLPTEAQWEWACRAGTASPLWYGGTDADFAKAANLADKRMAAFKGSGGPAWRPADGRYDDGAVVTAAIGGREPNAWGLSDMHGNAAEWTASPYRPYPYRDDAESTAVQSAIPGRRGDRNSQSAIRMAVRGGSFYDRPMRCRSAWRLSYPPWQGVYNVGFRVTVEDAAQK